MNVYFIVLHYLNIEETVNCIESILNIVYEHKRIIIVDNGSLNGTGEKLKEKYSQYKEVDVIISKENLGFAKGNNLGIKSIKDSGPYLAVICNSDLIFYDKNFINGLISSYNKNSFAVLGPSIQSEDGLKHECPSELEISNEHALNKEIKKMKFLKKINDIKLVQLSRFFHKVMARSRETYPYDKFVDNSIKPIKVHGSCFVLSNLYLKKFNGLFDGTFLFQEENILANMCYINELKIVYDPSIAVIHLGSKSYKVKYKNPGKRYCNYINNSLNSLVAYKKYIESKAL